MTEPATECDLVPPEPLRSGLLPALLFYGWGAAGSPPLRGSISHEGFPVQIRRLVRLASHGEELTYVARSRRIWLVSERDSPTEVT